MQFRAWTSDVALSPSPALHIGECKRTAPRRAGNVQGPSFHGWTGPQPCFSQDGALGGIRSKKKFAQIVFSLIGRYFLGQHYGLWFLLSLRPIGSGYSQGFTLEMPPYSQVAHPSSQVIHSHANATQVPTPEIGRAHV